MYLSIFQNIVFLQLKLSENEDGKGYVGRKEKEMEKEIILCFIFGCSDFQFQPCGVVV